MKAVVPFVLLPLLAGCGGDLEVVADCLGADGVVVIWPHGTEVTDEDPLTIEVPGYGTFALGDEVHLAGGMVFEQTSDQMEAAPVDVGGVTVPLPCAKRDVFLAH